MGKFSRLGNELYNGHRSFDFVGKRALWYSITLGIISIAVLGLWLKPLNFGVEFTGGTEYRVDKLTSFQADQAMADRVRNAVADTGIDGATDPIVNTIRTKDGKSLAVQIEKVSTTDGDKIQTVICETIQIPKANCPTGATKGASAKTTQISRNDVSASWGKEVANRAGLGVAVFLVLVVLFIWGYFREWKMSVAALVALFHDIVITIGVYALSGFQVTPAAVTGLLAILGFSLYDTVVVFDKIRENTHELRKKGQSYAEAANLAVNQTLVRSVNTGIVALIPIGAILYVSAVQLGSSSLKDLALSQFVGMAAGVFSSVCVAPRIVVHLKQIETADRVARHEARVQARASKVDPYAAVVPAFRENMPLYDSETGEATGERTVTAKPEGTGAAAVSPPQPDDSAMGLGRVVPENPRPVEESGSAKRAQPTRSTRSDRTKK